MHPLTANNSDHSVADIVESTISRLTALEAELEVPKEKRDSERVREILHQGLDILVSLPNRITEVTDPLSELVLPDASALADLAKNADDTLRRYPDDFTLLPLYFMGVRGFPIEDVQAIRNKLNT